MNKDNNKDKEISDLIENLRNKFGEGAIMRLGEQKLAKMETIPSGSFSLDLALGVGGLPRGRTVELYGPEMSGKSTLTLQAIAEVQKRRGKAAYIDAEHAFDIEYAKNLGVKTEELLLSQPDSGEEALNILDSLVKSGMIDLIVVDSVAALTPQAEIEGEMGAQFIGLQARMMGQALRKLTAITAKSKAVIIFINQIRSKIGVMFGCFSYDSLVLLADGTKEKIGKIVNQQKPLKVLSYNFKKQCLESQSIIDWHINGETKEFLQFFVQNHTGNGRRGFSCTPEHKIYTPQGWGKAKDLKVGDEIMILIEQEKFSPMQEQILLGSILGDGNLKKRQEQSAYFREEHGPKQRFYAKWLGKILGNLISNIQLQTVRNTAIIESRHLLALGQLWNIFYPNGKKIVPAEIVSPIEPPALAAWYCSDGSLQTGYSWWKGTRYERKPRAALYTNGFTDQESREHIMRIFSRFNLKPTLRKMKNTRVLQFSVSESPKFFELVAPYIPPSMQYKLPPFYRNKYKELSPQKTEKYSTLQAMKIKEIRKRIPYQDGQRISKKRFDITVAGNHNYFVDGCLVSNSPETTPGGRALKFFASVRIDLRSTAKIKKGEEIIGQRVKAKVVKNKVAPPFKTAEFDIIYGQGISYEGDVLNTALKYGVVTKSGNTYNFEKQKLGVGFEATKEKLKEDKKLLEEIKKQTVDVAQKS